MKCLSAVLLSLVATISLYSQDHPLDSLTIVHWNDFHAQNTSFTVTERDEAHTRNEVGSASVVSTVIQTLRAGGNSLALDAGDEFQGTPISSMTHGRSQIQIANIFNPDAMVVGNHEFDYTADTLREVLKAAKFPILCANVLDLTTGKTFGRQYIIKTVGKIKVAIIGITAPSLERLTIRANLSSVRVLDRDSVLGALLPKIQSDEKPNLIVLVSHEGLDEDSIVAEKFSQINVIVAGHDHKAVPVPRKVSHTIIVEAGSKGQYVGDLHLVVDLQDNSVVRYDGKLAETTPSGVRTDWNAQTLVDGFERQVNEGLSKVIGRVVTALTRDTKDSPECNLGDFECDAFRANQYAPAQIAFVNITGLRKNLDTGKVTLRDIWEVNPFGNTLVEFTV
ncbi:MAG TPA: bifunctional UDP-sugar hydrolase/5'-nucleotidase, partial [Bacteroidota bacterium]|nr:bifunctional UDP-sugar hydrolase/5'-nucleotidase [Bacteroidota bacterium]